MNMLLIVGISFSIGIVAGKSETKQPKKRIGTPVPLHVGDPVSLSTNGFEDGKNYHRELVVSKIIEKNGEPVAIQGDAQHQTWTIIVGEGEDRRGVILTAP
jgi:uncharacterized Zn-binding protein involved in type VI secretion